MHQRLVGGSRARGDPMAQRAANGSTGRELMGPDGRIKAARSKGLLMPSHTAYWALLLLPCVGWLLAVVAGMLHFEGVPADKRAVHHELSWFDRCVFRTAAGPALAFLVLLLRWLFMRLTTLTALNDAARAAPRGSLPETELTPLMTTTTPATATATVAAFSAEEGGGRAGGRAAAVAQAHASVARELGVPEPTLVVSCFFRYALVTGQRMILYGIHLLSQQLAAEKNGVGIKEAPSYLSDHLLLGSSVVACLQVELVCAISDLTKLDVLGMPMVWHALACCAALASLLLSCLVSADMYFTARYFHHPQESLVAVLVGAVALQGPLLLWLHRRKYTVCTIAAIAERT